MMLLTLIGCSGGAGSTSATPAMLHPGTSSAAASARVTFSIGAPIVTTAKALHPLYVSRGMKSLAIVVRTSTAADSRSVFTCPGSCTGGLDAPVGQDMLQITTYDGVDGTGNALSTGITSVNVRAGAANSFSAVLGGIVAKLTLALAPSAFTRGTPGQGMLAVVPLDASGNTIVGSDAFATSVRIALANGAFAIGTSVIDDPSKASIPISYNGAAFSAPASVTATAAGIDVASLPLMVNGNGISSTVTGRTVAANAFVDSIGVGTHLNYRGSVYETHNAAVVNAILDMHVKHVREPMLYPYASQPQYVQNSVSTLSSNGVHTIAGVLVNDLTASDFATRWSQWFDSVGGTSWVEGAEAPNECDLNNCLSLLPSYLQTLYRTVKGYAPSIGVPIVGPSFANSSSYANVGSLASYLDVGNVHLYTLSQPPETSGICEISDQCSNGASTGNGLPFTKELGSLVVTETVTSGTKPIINTEAGFCTTVDGSGNTRFNNVTRSVQAAYWPRYLLHAFGDLGIPRTYMYELADDGTSAPDFDQCGLLDASGTPKPSYRILRTILDAVNDPGAAIVPTTLAYTVAAPKNVDGNDVSSMALAARDGSYTVFVWNPVSLFYQTGGNGGDISHPLAVEPLAGNLTLGRSFSSAQVTTFDIATGNATTASANTAMAIPLSITPSVTMIRLRP